MRIDPVRIKKVKNQQGTKCVRTGESSGLGNSRWQKEGSGRVGGGCHKWRGLPGACDTLGTQDGGQ